MLSSTVEYLIYTILGEGYVDERYIPADVRRKLREEVGFCCPIPGCSSPYLSYHHFDPPFHEGGTHDTLGMIALCLPHHKNADIGTYTNEQLREFKTFSNTGSLIGRIEWMRRDVILHAGGLYAVRSKVLLQIGEEPLIWLNRNDKGYLMLNMNFNKSDGSPLLRIIDNDWEVTGPLKDLVAVPSGRSIKISIPNENFNVNLQFEEINKGFSIVLDNVEDIIWPSLYVGMSGEVNYPLKVKISKDKLVVSSNERKLETSWHGCTAVDTKIALRF